MWGPNIASPSQAADTKEQVVLPYFDFSLALTPPSDLPEVS